ncbi:SDR family NAD(P)-dependent oxidoreductase [Streptomyces sp. NPDC101455]|uniref:SDR family NAD(P)-dependent oxidoreductase n=1 Tax=Streptomyces sp. NPDC101455 TaxID=3366142 RepID=UPI0037F45C1E
MTNITNSSLPAKAWVVTGPTSGIGRSTALQLTGHGTVVLVGRDARKLAKVQAKVKADGGHALPVVADFSDVASVRRAAAEISALKLPIAGVLNNAGIMPLAPAQSAQGWDLAFATNHVGPFAFTEALIPYLADGTNVVFIASAVEDSERKIAAAAGFRGSRYISAEASARGEWKSDGSTHAGADAYATSKQGNLATVFALSREIPRLRFRAVEPGVNPGSNLVREMNAAIRLLSKAISPIAPLIPYYSSPKRAARVITDVLTDPSNATGVYYNENGKPMQASKQVSDPEYSDRYVAETRALLATVAPMA